MWLLTLQLCEALVKDKWKNDNMSHDCDQDVCSMKFSLYHMIHLYYYCVWCDYVVGFFTGKGLALALAEKGVFITIVDFSEERGRQVASLVEKINTKFHSKLGFPSAIFVKCDVSNASKWAIV